MPQLRTEYIYSYHRDQQHIMYVSFQVLSAINDYWYIRRIPVSFSGASIYNKSRRIMMLSQIARFMGPTWGPHGADMTQVSPMLAPWTLLSGMLLHWEQFNSMQS